MIVIEDSMVLIFLTKLDLMKQVKDMFGKVLISEAVKEETVTEGKEKGYTDAIKIERSIENGLIEVKKIKDKSKVEETMKEFGLGRGEAETIQLYFQENADLLICDEKRARNIAEILKINLLGTPELVLQLYDKKMISKEKAKQSILDLEKIGWFNSSVIFKALNEIGD
jgi:predicted nucleic acid-binding protein